MQCRERADQIWARDTAGTNRFQPRGCNGFRRLVGDAITASPQPLMAQRASEMITSVHEDNRLPFDISERRRAENGLRGYIERQAMLLEVTSDLIRTSEPSELGRKTFEQIGRAHV